MAKDWIKGAIKHPGALHKELKEYRKAKRSLQASLKRLSIARTTPRLSVRILLRPSSPFIKNDPQR